MPTDTHTPAHRAVSVQFTPYVSAIPVRFQTLSDDFQGCATEGATGENNGANGSPVFVIDTIGSAVKGEKVPLYETQVEAVLGVKEIKLESDPNARLNTPRQCFNCGSESHKLSACPHERNQEIIASNRERFVEENGQRPQFSRYYIEAERRTLINAFVPGVLSDALREALGINTAGEEPPYYKWMRIHGYPPGYLGYEAGEDPLKAVKYKERRAFDELMKSDLLKIFDVCDVKDDESDSEDASELDDKLDNGSDAAKQNCSNESGAKVNDTSKSKDGYNLHGGRNAYGGEDRSRHEDRPICKDTGSSQGFNSVEGRENRPTVRLVHYPGLNLDETAKREAVGEGWQAWRMQFLATYCNNYPGATPFPTASFNYSPSQSFSNYVNTMPVSHASYWMNHESFYARMAAALDYASYSAFASYPQPPAPGTFPPAWPTPAVSHMMHRASNTSAPGLGPPPPPPPGTAHLTQSMFHVACHVRESDPPPPGAQDVLVSTLQAHADSQNSTKSTSSSNGSTLLASGERTAQKMKEFTGVCDPSHSVVDGKDTLATKESVVTVPVGAEAVDVIVSDSDMDLSD